MTCAYNIHLPVVNQKCDDIGVERESLLKRAIYATPGINFIRKVIKINKYILFLLSDFFPMNF